MLSVNNLIGFGGGMVETVSATYITKVTFFSTGTGSNFVTIPNNGTVQVGDIAILCNMAYSGTSVTYTNPLSIPSGWTTLGTGSIATGVESGIAVQMSYKILGSSDLGAQVSAMVGQGPQGGSGNAIMFFRPSKGINQVTIGSYNSQARTSILSNQLINMSSATPCVIGLAHWAVCPSATFVNQNQSPAILNVLDTTTNQHKIGYVVYNPGTAPLSTTIGMGDGGTNGMQSLYITLQ